MKQTNTEPNESTHKEQCAILSAKLKEHRGDLRYEIVEAVSKMPGVGLTETAFFDAIFLLRAVNERYKKSKVFREGILNDAHVKAIFANRESSIGDRLKSLEVLFKNLSGFYTPGYIEIYRLLSEPKSFSQRDLDYMNTSYFNSFEEIMELLHSKAKEITEGNKKAQQADI